jgi:hypothetical protein
MIAILIFDYHAEKKTRSTPPAAFQILRALAGADLHSYGVYPADLFD